MTRCKECDRPIAIEGDVIDPDELLHQTCAHCLWAKVPFADVYESEEGAQVWHPMLEHLENRVAGEAAAEYLNKQTGTERFYFVRIA